MPVILLFLHGWGFDARFWEPLGALLPEHRLAFDDRGYFGAPQSAASGEPCVVVAHSHGAMRALAAPPPACLGLIAINGFDRFTADGDTPGVSPRIVDRMIAKFGEDPAAVLSDFRRRIGDEAPVRAADIDRLQADLIDLRHGDRTAEAAGFPAPILSLQGGRDPLLPAPMRDAAFAGAPLLERMTHPEAGHLLPVSDPAYCARAIRAFAEHAA
jgi:pimeloyl-[acyl-carrier protein] methyl ester esterase